MNISLDCRLPKKKVLNGLIVEVVMSESSGIKDLEFLAEAELKTAFGHFHIRGYRYQGKDCVSLHMPGKIKTENLLVRVQSCCLFGETFNSLDCDCRWQVHHSLQRIAEAGNGILIYLYQEGRGIGIVDKIRAYQIQQQEQCDTVEAFAKLGFKDSDLRTYDAAVAILKHYEVDEVKILTNNPEKAAAFRENGFSVNTHSLLPEASDFKDISLRAGDFAGLFSYLETKRSKMKQDIPQDMIDSLRESMKGN